LDFEEFREQFKDDIAERLYGDGYGSMEFQDQETRKVNEKYESTCIKPEGSNVGVNLNVEAAYKAYQDGTPYDEIVDSTIKVVENGFDNMPRGDFEQIKNYDTAKERLTMEVVAISGNEEMLANLPHKEMEDMAVIYRLDASDIAGQNASIVVTNQMVDSYGITPEQLHADALKNAPEIKPVVIEGMAEVLAKQMGVEDLEMLGLNIPPEQEKIFVASVEGNVHGAGVIAYTDFMDQAAERVGGDFYLLPSSRHEVLLVPDDGTIDLKSLENMVREVNATTVSAEDKLTDSVYHYDSQEKVFELAEKYVDRQRDIDKAETAEKEAVKPDPEVPPKDPVAPDIKASVDKAEAKAEGKETEPTERKSVLADLKAKKEQVAAQPRKEVDKSKHKSQER